MRPTIAMMDGTLAPTRSCAAQEGGTRMRMDEHAEDNQPVVKRPEAYQVGVVLLVVLPEGGGGRDHQHHVAEDAEYLIVERLLERQEVAELVLRTGGSDMSVTGARRACRLTTCPSLRSSGDCYARQKPAVQGDGIQHPRRARTDRRDARQAPYLCAKQVLVGEAGDDPAQAEDPAPAEVLDHVAHGHLEERDRGDLRELGEGSGS